MGATHTSRLEPLRFARIFLEKVWGGRALERAPGIELPPDRPIGETWELVDRGEHNSVVADGRFRGRTLRELMASDGDAILGRARAASGGRFPLLVKFLDATQTLSVQVHPQRASARAGEESKTEAWYILSAAPGSAIYLGLRPDVRREQVVAQARAPQIVDLLARFEVSAGQFVFVPGGTVHAIGAGITLVEVQDNSDVTLRFYDWGRVGLDGQPRSLQVDEALRAIDYGARVAGPIVPRIERDDAASARAPLVDCEPFEIELVEVEGGAFESDTADAAIVYVAIAGSGAIRGASSQRWVIGPGDTWLVPACFGRHALETTGSLRLLRARTKC